MKLAIVTHFPKDPEKPKGGVEVVSVNLVKELANFKDLDIHVITQDFSNSIIDISSWHGVTVHRLPGIKGNKLINAIGRGRRQISNYLLNLAPHVVHAHDTYGLMVKGLRIPRVFTIHGFIYADTRVSKTKWAWIRSKIWRWIETRGWADQPHIISISPHVREHLSGISRGVIHDIDNPISDEFFEIPRGEKKGVIFSASVICPRKNTLALIEAFGKLVKDGMEAELRLSGAITEPHYGQLVQERIKKEDVIGKVSLLGWISTEHFMEELANASIFALVSLEENSPLGIAEAMAAGVPVVTSNRCGMPYMVRHGETGFLVNPIDTCDIAKRLKLLLEEDSLRVDMGEKSRAVALDRYRPSTISKRTRAVYYEVCGIEENSVENKF
ncbi:MAG: glycosyltransferase family 4 protein [Candidatus Hodarchaeota archaeon]